MTTEAELQALRQRMSNVLMGPACASIAFSLPGLTIRPGGYMVIGASLAVPHASGRTTAARRPMSVRVNTHLGRHVGASYSGSTNTISVPSADFGVGADQCLSIVHESTHAVFDYFSIRASAYIEEAAAYIAGALYHRFVMGVPFGSGIHGEAETIAAHIRAPQRIGGTPNNVVTQDILDPLLAAIRTSPAYRFLREERRGYGYSQDGGAI
jgi:hypothetical protein